MEKSIRKIFFSKRSVWCFFAQIDFWENKIVEMKIRRNVRGEWRKSQAKVSLEAQRKENLKKSGNDDP